MRWKLKIAFNVWAFGCAVWLIVRLSGIVYGFLYTSNCECATDSVRPHSIDGHNGLWCLREHKMWVCSAFWMEFLLRLSSPLCRALNGNKTVRSRCRDAVAHDIASTVGTASLVASMEMRWDGKGIVWWNERCIRRRPRDASVHRCDGAETTWIDHLFCLHLTFIRRVSVRACLTRIVCRVYLPAVFSTVFHLSFGILLPVCMVCLHLARRAHIHTVNAWIIAYCVSI